MYQDTEEKKCVESQHPDEFSECGPRCCYTSSHIATSQRLSLGDVCFDNKTIAVFSEKKCSISKVENQQYSPEQYKTSRTSGVNSCFIFPRQIPVNTFVSILGWILAKRAMGRDSVISTVTGQPEESGFDSRQRQEMFLLPEISIYRQWTPPSLLFSG
jgi:hypothetical protein